MVTEDWLHEPSRAKKRIIFARHGQYACNVRGVCNSDPRTSYPLTDTGIAQAKHLGRMLRNENIGVIVTSEFQRARQTAWLAAQAFERPVPQVVNRLANENRVGDAFEGKSAVEFLRSIAHAPATASSPDGEPFIDLVKRVQFLIADLSLSGPSTILVVAHGWTLQAVRVIKGDIAPDEAAQNVGMPGNCEVVNLVT